MGPAGPTLRARSRESCLSETFSGLQDFARSLSGREAKSPRSRDEGTVSEFQDEKGRVVYAWAVEGKEPQYLAVIKEPPIKSPLDAVRAWLVSQARK